MKIYGDHQSGNCYKVQLTCALLNIEYQWQAVNIVKEENKHKSFLEKSPNGKIPLLVLNDGRCISESNAIINYLAFDTWLLPIDPFALAKVQQWQFFEQYSHEPYIAVARFIAKYLGLPDNKRKEYESKHEGGYMALKLMEQQLQKCDYLTGSALTTADISLYAYTHVAHEGGFELSKLPALNQWLKRIETHDNYVPMNTNP